MTELVKTDHDSHGNHRLRKRHQLIFYITVIDIVTCEELGKLVDISSQSFMLTSPEKLNQEHYA